ncbi:hypothetical protein QL285_026434 [Trifolium repens]|jgi:hypothetical protein|nr:hypothetical protein QL285_026434 [Trifolium repens]
MMLGLWPSKLCDSSNLLLRLRGTSEIFEHVNVNLFFFSKTEKLMILLILRSYSVHEIIQNCSLIFSDVFGLLCSSGGQHYGQVVRGDKFSWLMEEEDYI